MTTLTLNGKRVLCTSVTLSGKKSLDVKPNANIDGPVEAQTLAFENLTLTLNKVKFPFTTTDLANTALFHYSDLLTMYKHKYDGTNAYSLKVNFGPDNTLLSGLDSTNTTDIPVVLGTWDMPISMSDSQSGYMPEATITLTETK